MALFLAIVEVLACAREAVERELEGVGVLGIEKLGDGDEVGYFSSPSATAAPSRTAGCAGGSSIRFLRP